MVIGASWRSFVGGESGTFLLIIICIQSGTLLGNVLGGSSQCFWGGVSEWWFNAVTATFELGHLHGENLLLLQTVM